VRERGRWGCEPAFLERLTRSMERQRFDQLAEIATRISPVKRVPEEYGSSIIVNEYRAAEQAERQIRFALYQGQIEELLVTREEYRLYMMEYGDPGPLALFYRALPDVCWLKSLPPRVATLMAAEACDAALRLALPSQGAFRALCALVQEHGAEDDYVLEAQARQLLVRDLHVQASAALLGCTSSGSRSLMALVLLAQGDAAGAVTQWEASLEAQRKLTRKRKLYPARPEGFFYVVATLAVGHARQAQALSKLGRNLSEGSHEAYHELEQASLRCQGSRLGWDSSRGSWRGLHPLELLAVALGRRWSERELDEPRLEALTLAAAQCKKAGYTWLAAELRGVTAAGAGASGSLRALVVPAPRWLQRLEELERLDSAPEPRRTAVVRRSRGDERLVWLIDHDGELEPRIQKRGAKGWTKGRKVALKRLLHEPGSFPFLAQADREVLSNLEEEVEWGRYGNSTYHYFEQPEALAALAGHALVFKKDALGEPVELLEAEPRLCLTSEGDGLQLRVEPPIPGGEWELVWEGERRAVLFAASPEQRELAKLLGEGLWVPAREAARLRTAAEAMAPRMPLQLGEAVASQSRDAQQGDTTPWLGITPTTEGLAFTLRVRPLGQEGPALLPGAGQAALVAQVQGHTRRFQRAMEEETRRVQAMLLTCPALAEALGEDMACELPLNQALATLQRLDELEDRIRIHWSRSAPWRVCPDRHAGHLQLRIRTHGEALDLAGRLQLGEQNLDLGRLLSLLADSPSRFVRLEPGRFVALTEQFRQRLEALARVADKSCRVPRFAALLLEELCDGAAELQADQAWRALRDRMRAAQEQDQALPSTLRCELRTYQRQGFAWLTRLASWGAGACLADDMGLGKTVQALALALQRAPGGPTLVVAPTSVCGIWLAEAARFTPTLRAQRFGGGDRQAALKALGSMDLLVCSYGLLVAEKEALCGISWRTVVLDEAQAIKNPRTKRHQAAVALQADFRLLTTGTPIENRLEELWSLFRFLNPGLLGSLRAFRDRFALPIERDRDPAARRALRRLLRPFILRRTKSQVLDELPPRSDVVFPVVLGSREAAHYEALRQAALKKARSAGGATMTVLAEITRLRRACCHPALATPKDPPPSAKLQAFQQLVDQLRAGGHRALVFSQFVGHLAILRKALDERAIPYQYLDGTTPSAARDRAVRDFQAGGGDLFLISLRAGGFGLNLTAADYVLHMDPWWNPAVEDQASDRAHRIGQTRPVTVYRLVAQGTIEEGVLALHREKRALAQRMLAGSHEAAKVTADEWLALLERE